MSTAGEIDATAFVAFEAGWERRASADHDFFAPITSRAIGLFLDAARVVRETRPIRIRVASDRPPWRARGRAWDRDPSPG